MERIRQILEDDYGCEERAADAPEMVLLLLEAADGTRRWLRLPGEEADRLGLREGGAVCVTADGRITGDMA